jgi:hypothetical protein
VSVAIADQAVETATGTALAMVAIEMILTLGHQLGKDFNLAAYAAAISAADHAETSPVDRQARQNVAAMLTRLSGAAGI